MRSVFEIGSALVENNSDDDVPPVVVHPPDSMTISNGLRALGDYTRAYALAQGLAIDSDHDREQRILHLISEVGEFIEVLRTGPDAPSPQVPGLRHVEEELADVLALTLLIADSLDVDLGVSLQRKLDFSIQTRPHRHGKRW